MLCDLKTKCTDAHTTRSAQKHQQTTRLARTRGRLSTFHNALQLRVLHQQPLRVHVMVHPGPCQPVAGRAPGIWGIVLKWHGSYLHKNQRERVFNKGITSSRGQMVILSNGKLPTSEKSNFAYSNFSKFHFLKHTTPQMYIFSNTFWVFPFFPFILRSDIFSRPCDRDRTSKTSDLRSDIVSHWVFDRQQAVTKAQCILDCDTGEDEKSYSCPISDRTSDVRSREKWKKYREGSVRPLSRAAALGLKPLRLPREQL